MALHVDRAQDVAAGRDDDLSVPRLTFTLLYQTGINGNPFRWRFILRSEEGHDEFVASDSSFSRLPGLSNPSTSRLR